MKAKVKTKSNFKGLNNQFLPVKEIAGKRVSCLFFCPELNKEITIDFSLSEIVEFSN